MKGRCRLCGERHDVLDLWKITNQPALPRTARERIRICWDCSHTLTEVDGEDGVCLWCGSPKSSEYYVVVRTNEFESLGFLCRDCLSKESDYPDEFSEDLKRKMRRRAGKECERCGVDQSSHREEHGQRLHVHHKDRDKQNNEPDNLEVLCKSCHEEEHGFVIGSPR